MFLIRLAEVDLGRNDEDHTGPINQLVEPLGPNPKLLVADISLQYHDFLRNYQRLGKQVVFLHGLLHLSSCALAISDSSNRRDMFYTRSLNEWAEDMRARTLSIMV